MRLYKIYNECSLRVRALYYHIEKVPACSVGGRHELEIASRARIPVRSTGMTQLTTYDTGLQCWTNGRYISL